MIFKPVLARAVAAGRKTQTRRPVRPGEKTCRYREGRTYAVQPGRGKPGLARIRILHTELQQLGDLTYQDAKAEGFRTRDDFYAYWTDLYNISEPDLAQPVWAIRFQVDTDPPRLLHKDSSRGYTSDPRLAIRDEPEAIGEADLRRLHSARHAAEQQHRQERSIAARLREAQARARRNGVDISPELAALERQLAAIRAKLGDAA